MRVFVHDVSICNVCYNFEFACKAEYVASVVLPKYRYLANDAGSRLFSQTATVETIFSKGWRANEVLDALH